MKLSRELKNGVLIFVGIGIYFALINLLGYANVFYLRLLNVIFVFYGVNKTLSMNIADGKKEFLPNAISGMTTALIGIFLSLVGLLVYSYLKGGDAYVQTLSETFLFGGNPTVVTYTICLLFEGIASSLIVTMLLLFYWNNKYAAD